MIARRQNVGQTGQIAYLCHGLSLVGEFQQVEVRVGNHDVVGLAAYPSAHVHVAVCRARPRWIDIQTDASGAFLAVSAATAGNVKRYRDQIAYLDELNITAGLDYFAGDLVSQNEALGRGGAASDHVLVAAANISGNDFEKYAVFTFTIPERQLREVDAMNLHDSGTHIYHSTIACHARRTSLGEFSFGLSSHERIYPRLPSSQSFYSSVHGKYSAVPGRGLGTC